MTGAIMKITAERSLEICELKLVGGTTSQWLAAGSMRSAFCIGIGSASLVLWTVEGLLPNDQIVTLADYPLTGPIIQDPPPESSLFQPGKPRYISVNAMCGLPIRFVASVAPSPLFQLWVMLKS